MKFWVIINKSGESWQHYGKFADALSVYEVEGNSLDNIIAIVSH